MTHTPGPWRFDGPILKAGPNGKHLFELTECNGLGLEATANVSLIAAAPDMLAALQEAAISLACAAKVIQPPEDSVFMDSLRGARAAIAKAEGK